MEPRTIFFVGKPGSGKGTQAEILSKKTGWPVITAGDQFRSIAEESTPVGRKIKSEVDAGLLTPHWFAEYLFLKSLFNLPSDSGVIFDGFSRRAQEAEIIINSLKWIGRPFAVVNVEVSDDSVKRRLEIRKDVAGRADDNAVEKRLTEYAENTKPAIEVFRKEGVLIDVDGEPSVEEIAKNIQTALNLK